MEVADVDKYKSKEKPRDFSVCFSMSASPTSRTEIDLGSFYGGRIVAHKYQIPKTAVRVDEFHIKEPFRLVIVKVYEAWGSLGGQSDFKYVKLLFVDMTVIPGGESQVRRFTGKNIAGALQKIKKLKAAR